MITAVALAGGAAVLPLVERALRPQGGGGKLQQLTKVKLGSLTQVAAPRVKTPTFVQPSGSGYFWTVGFHPNTESGVVGKGHEANPPEGRVQRAKNLVGPVPHRRVSYREQALDTWEKVETAFRPAYVKWAQRIENMSASSSVPSLMAEIVQGGFPLPGWDDLPAHVEFLARGGEKAMAALDDHVKRNGANRSAAKKIVDFSIGAGLGLAGGLLAGPAGAQIGSGLGGVVSDGIQGDWGGAVDSLTNSLKGGFGAFGGL